MRATRSRRSWGRGAETAAGRAAGPVLVAVSELPGLLIYITAGAVVPAAAGVWSNDVAYHRTITRRRGAANIWTAPDSLEVVTSGKVGVHGIEKAHPAELRERAVQMVFELRAETGTRVGRAHRPDTGRYGARLGH